MTMKQRDTLHNYFKSDIKTGKSRCFIYSHKRKQGHEIDWEKKVILDKEINFEKRKIKEATYINAFDNGTLLNPDKGIPINQCWTEFFPFIQKLRDIRMYLLFFYNTFHFLGIICIFAVVFSQIVCF